MDSHEGCFMETKRFYPAKSNAGIPAIRDSMRNRLVGIIFVDREKPEGAEYIVRVCCAALNAEMERHAGKAENRG